MHQILEEGLSLVRAGAQVVSQRIASGGIVVLADSVATGKRKRSADCTGLPHQTLTECGDIAGVWNEYVGTDGQGGLRRRERLNPKWAGSGDVNKPNRDLFTEKKFIYRESAYSKARTIWPFFDLLGNMFDICMPPPPAFAVAKQMRDLGNIPDALKAVQERLDGFKKQGSGGWGGKKVGLLGALRSEQPEGTVRDALTNLLAQMDTSR